jgi:hypothetical protein
MKQALYSPYKNIRQSFDSEYKSGMRIKFKSDLSCNFLLQFTAVPANTEVERFNYLTLWTTAGIPEFPNTTLII